MYQLKRQYNRLIAITNIVGLDGKNVKRNIGSAGDVKATEPATQFAPARDIIVKGISQKEIQNLIDKKLPLWDRFDKIEVPETKTENTDKNKLK